MAKKRRLVLVHENEDGEELERSEPFAEENEGAIWLEQFARSINFFEGDAVRMIRLDSKSKRGD